jgi:phospholipid/cholesterol/gamma-HCH transport system substrate-binding protein
MPRTRSLAWSQLKIGVVAVTALVLAAVFIYLIGGEGGFFWQQYSLKARFANVQGLQTGAAVRLAGVTVGTVDAIEFVGAEVDVTINISTDMQDKITTDSTASIGSLSLLGAAVIDLSPAPSGRVLQEWEYVPSRAPYGQLADVADRATVGLEETTALIRDLRAGEGTLGRLLADDTLYREMTAFVGAAEDVVTSINESEGTLGQLINDPKAYEGLRASLTNLSEITARLRAGEGGLGRLLADDAFARSLTSTTANLDELTAKMARGEGTLGRMVNDPTLFTRLSTVSERLDAVLSGLDSGEGTAGQLLRDKQLYENMNQAVTEMRSLLADIRSDPRKYLNVRVSIF